MEDNPTVEITQFGRRVDGQGQPQPTGVTIWSGDMEKVILLIMRQAQCDRRMAEQALLFADGDIFEAILQF